MATASADTMHSPGIIARHNIQRPCLFHATEWGPEIIADNAILGNSTINPQERLTKASDLRFDAEHHSLQGICVTRSFYFAQQFSDVIFALDREAIAHHHKILLRAEKDAYDLANEHGDFRIEAEEFIVASKLDLNAHLLAIWLKDDHQRTPEYWNVIAHPKFAGIFRQP